MLICIVASTALHSCFASVSACEIAPDSQPLSGSSAAILATAAALSAAAASTCRSFSAASVTPCANSPPLIADRAKMSSIFASASACCSKVVALSASRIAAWSASIAYLVKPSSSATSAAAPVPVILNRFTAPVATLYSSASIWIASDAADCAAAICCSRICPRSWTSWVSTVPYFSASLSRLAASVDRSLSAPILSERASVASSSVRVSFVVLINKGSNAKNAPAATPAAAPIPPNPLRSCGSCCPSVRVIGTPISICTRMS